MKEERLKSSTLFFNSDHADAGKGSVQFVPTVLHHSAAEMTWLLEWSRVCQRSSANGLWLLRISSYNPAVHREAARKKEVIWKLWTLHMTILLRSVPLREEVRKCKYIRLGLSSGSCTIQWGPIYTRFSTARWGKKYEWPKRCHDFEEGACLQLDWATNKRQNTGELPVKRWACLRERNHENFWDGCVSVGKTAGGTRRTADVWHTRTSGDLKDTLQE